MVEPSAELTVAELERMLTKRRQELTSLIGQRDKLQKELDVISRRITELQGGSDFTPSRSPAYNSGRGRNPVSLRHTVISILTQYPPGYALSDLSDKIIETGYKTSSKNFRNVLYQCLYNTPQIYHDSKTGTYRINPKSDT